MEGLVRDTELLVGTLGDRHPLPRGLSISQLGDDLLDRAPLRSPWLPLLVLTFSLGLTEEMDQFLGAGHILPHSRYGDCVANQHEVSRKAVKQFDRVLVPDLRRQA